MRTRSAGAGKADGSGGDVRKAVIVFKEDVDVDVDDDVDAGEGTGLDKARSSDSSSDRDEEGLICKGREDDTHRDDLGGDGDTEGEGLILSSSSAHSASVGVSIEVSPPLSSQARCSSVMSDPRMSSPSMPLLSFPGIDRRRWGGWALCCRRREAALW